MTTPFKSIRKNILTTGLLAASLAANAQWVGNCGIGVYLPCSALIGGAGPASHRLQVRTNVAGDGIRVNNGAGDAILMLEDQAGGQAWTLHSLSSGDYQLTDGSSNAAITFNGITDYVGIGTTSPSVRLHVVEANDLFAGRFNVNTSITGDHVALLGDATVTGGTTNAVGVWGRTNGGTGFNYGVQGSISGTSGSGVNTGIYGSWNSTGTYAGYFNGDVNINGVGTITSGSWSTSDKRFKKNISRIENVNERIGKLNAYTYDFRREEFKEKNFDDRKHIGFLAQELKDVFPELVRQERDGFYAVDYQGMVPVLLEAIKDLQKQVNDQKAITESLLNEKSVKTGIEQGVTANSTGVEMSNRPNPFSKETVISYSLPSLAGEAYLSVCDLTGKQLLSYPISQKSGTVTVSSEKLSAGIYIYSIVANGELMGSKRMVVKE